MGKLNSLICGFTLIEVMIAISILTVIMGMTLAAFTVNENYRDLTAIRVQLYRQNKRALDLVTEELMSSANGTVLVIDNGTADEIRFQAPLNVSTDGNYTVSWGANGGSSLYPGCFTSYRLSARQLMRRVVDACGALVAGTEEIRASDLIELQISNTTPNFFYIRTTSARNMTLTPQRQIRATSEAQVYLLNKRFDRSSDFGCAP